MYRWIFLTILVVVGLFGLGWIYAGKTPTGVQLGIDQDQLQQDIEQVVETAKGPVAQEDLTLAKEQGTELEIEP